MNYYLIYILHIVLFMYLFTVYQPFIEIVNLVSIFMFFRAEFFTVISLFSIYTIMKMVCQKSLCIKILKTWNSQSCHFY